VNALRSLDESPDDRRLKASTVEFRGMLASKTGDWPAAAEDFTAAQKIHQAIGNAYGATLMSYRLGEAAAALGELPRARELLTAAYASFTADRRERLAGRAAFALAGVQTRLADADEALPLYEAALTAARRRGAVREELRVLEALSASGALGEEEAGRYAAEAAALRPRLGLD
jgi:hypothetical protein